MRGREGGRERGREGGRERGREGEDGPLIAQENLPSALSPEVETLTQIGLSVGSSAPLSATQTVTDGVPSVTS